ncbi:GNAT family N-acetyltransferase [Nocardiopsis alba]|uniref:GNAT family N-acetyltransferase n=1 Tax=Nocardiopsis alba TaxID=53437 RepID=UPI00339EF434
MPEKTRIPYLKPDELSVPPIMRPIRDGYRIARWNSPAALEPSCRDRLQATLLGLAARAFGADHSDYWRARVASGFFDQISCLALILDPQGVPVGWGGYHRRRFASRRALYLDAAGVVPAHRRFGLSSALTTHFLTREILTHPWSGTYVVLRTRNPAVYSGWRKGVGAAHVFPRRDQHVPPDIARVSWDAAKWLGDGPGLDPDTLLIHNAYRMFEGRIYGVAPRSGDPELDAYFAREVGPKDAVMVVARMNALTLARTLFHRSPRPRRPALAPPAHEGPPTRPSGSPEGISPRGRP